MVPVKTQIGIYACIYLTNDHFDLLFPLIFLLLLSKILVKVKGVQEAQADNRRDNHRMEELAPLPRS